MVGLERVRRATIVGKPDQLVPTIEKIIAAVNAGELDAPNQESAKVMCGSCYPTT
jgi:hypothetical protein